MSQCKPRSLKYTIYKVVTNAPAKNSIPYIYHIVLKGPRGGLILCDYYNAERLIRQTASIDHAGMIENWLISYAHRHPEKLEQLHLTIEELQNERLDSYKHSPYAALNTKLIRNSNEALFNKIKSNFSLEDV